MGMSVQVFATQVKHLFGERLFEIILDTEHLFGKTIEHPFATVPTTKTTWSRNPSPERKSHDNHH